MPDTPLALQTSVALPGSETSPGGPQRFFNNTGMYSRNAGLGVTRC